MALAFAGLIVAMAFAVGGVMGHAATRDATYLTSAVDSKVLTIENGQATPGARLLFMPKNNQLYQFFYEDFGYNGIFALDGAFTPTARVPPEHQNCRVIYSVLQPLNPWVLDVQNGNDGDAVVLMPRDKSKNVRQYFRPIYDRNDRTITPYRGSYTGWQSCLNNNMMLDAGGKDQFGNPMLIVKRANATSQSQKIHKEVCDTKALCGPPCDSLAHCGPP